MGLLLKINNMIKYTLNKLPEGFVITSNEPIEKDWKGVAYKKNVQGYIFNHFYTENPWYNDTKKVIAQQDQIDFTGLAEDEQKEIGYFDIKKSLEKILSKELNYNNYWRGIIYGNPQLISAIQELLSDKFTLEDMASAYTTGYKDGAGLDKHVPQFLSEYVKSLSQPKTWTVQLEMDSVHTDHVPGGFEYFPKTIDGKVKIVKIL
jgi:hypothetical protein